MIHDQTEPSHQKDERNLCRLGHLLSFYDLCFVFLIVMQAHSCVLTRKNLTNFVSQKISVETFILIKEVSIHF